MLTSISCPGCKTPHSGMMPTSAGTRFTTRCISPACNRQFTILVKSRDGNKNDLLVVSGFLPKDDKADADRWTVKGLDKLPLDDTRMLVNDRIATIDAFLESYQRERSRLCGYLGDRTNRALAKAAEEQDRRLRAAQARAEGDKRILRSKEKEDRAALPPKDRLVGKVKEGVDLTVYRNNLLSFLDMKVSMGQVSKERAVLLKEKVHTQGGLWELADACGMPRLD